MLPSIAFTLYDVPGMVSRWFIGLATIGFLTHTDTHRTELRCSAHTQCTWGAGEGMGQFTSGSLTACIGACNRRSPCSYLLPTDRSKDPFKHARQRPTVAVQVMQTMYPTDAYAIHRHLANNNVHSFIQGCCTALTWRSYQQAGVRRCNRPRPSSHVITCCLQEERKKEGINAHNRKGFG